MQYTRPVGYEMDTDEPLAKRFKQDGSDSQSEQNLSFAISTQQTDDKKGKNIRDATSHRITEKRRRDRMNNCLADLNKLMPSHYSKQSQGRIEKTEIIEMAIKLIKSLQTDVEKNEFEKGQDPMCLTPLGENAKPCCISKFYMGFKECQDEVMRFLVENEDNNMSDQVCVCMMEYLGKAAKKFLPTGRRIKEDVDYNGTLSYPTRMTSRGSSDSLSPSSADGNISNDNYINSDSGFTNMDSAFSSMSLPLRKCQTESVQLTSSTAQEFYANYKISNSSSCSGQGTYKFKYNITQRFAQQAQKVQQSDTSSSSSHEEHNLQTARQRILKKMLFSYSHGSTAYPSSSDGSYNQSALHSSVKSAGGQAQPASDSNINLYLPGFVLHPSGSHYFPISIDPARVPQSYLSSIEGSSLVFHPISIPVRFCGPCIPVGANIQNPQ
ncbi:uncharacterized protein LOC121367244 [Gigantopelta aegis]|uniref:uncharacterized protein LOC121367244 n=1 Tax=Gigantopelta aegis TaxID=1735272 RepID=UPI001B8896EA|nr:uncharacterized protein LOC121367244 [Gigantopelta aegis]